CHSDRTPCTSPFILHAHITPRTLPSFPTRRSSDLFNKFDRILTRACPQKLQGSHDAELTKAWKILWIGKLDVGEGVRKAAVADRSEEHTSELQSRSDLVCRLLLEKKNSDYPLDIVY